MTPMTPDTLRSFAVLAEELHFTRAARRLRVAQPALSKHIRQLETHLGVPLFDRTRRSVQMTPEGELLLLHARRVLEVLADLEGTARRLRAGQAGRLRIGFAPSAPHHVLPAIMRQFRERYPDVETVLVEAGSVEQVQQLLAGDLDVGIVRPPADRPASLDFHVLIDEPYVAVLPKDHRLASRAQIRLRDLAGDPLILVSRTVAAAVYDQVLAGCRAAGFVPTVLHEASHYHAVAGLVGAGCGVSILAASIEHVRLPHVVYRPLMDAAFTSPMGLAVPAHHRSPALAAFVNTASAIFQPGRPATAPVQDPEGTVPPAATPKRTRTRPR